MPSPVNQILFLNLALVLLMISHNKKKAESKITIPIVETKKIWLVLFLPPKKIEI